MERFLNQYGLEWEDIYSYEKEVTIEQLKESKEYEWHWMNAQERKEKMLKFLFFENGQFRISNPKIFFETYKPNKSLTFFPFWFINCLHVGYFPPTEEFRIFITKPDKITERKIFDTSYVEKTFSKELEKFKLMSLFGDTTVEQEIIKYIEDENIKFCNQYFLKPMDKNFRNSVYKLL